MESKKTYIVEVNGVRHKHTSVVCVAIFENLNDKNRGYDYNEPVLYLQTRRKVPQNRRKFKWQEYVKEIIYPLNAVTKLI